MNTVDDRLSNQCDVIQEEPEDIGARPADFADLHEEQNPDVENPQEAVEIAEAGAKPRDGRFSLTTLIIDLAVLVARKLALKAK